MKIHSLKTLLFIGIAATITMAACKKDDTTAPVVTLKGDNPMNINVGATFTDPGATATDDTDGAITDIDVTGSVTTSTAGTYTLKYSATDEAGNTGSATRTVNVKRTRDNYLGTYTVSENCPSPYALNTTPTISAGSSANQIVISLFYFNGGQLTATVNGNDVTIDAGQAPQPILDGVTGSGTMNAAGTQIVFELTFSPSGSPSVTCTATYTKN